MRKQCQPKPQEGQERLVQRFLWWPLHLNEEWRWLEWATIRQIYLTRQRKFGFGKVWVTYWGDAQFEPGYPEVQRVEIDVDRLFKS